MSDAEDLKKVIDDFVEASTSQGLKEALAMLDYLLKHIPPDRMDLLLSEMTPTKLLEFGQMLGPSWKEANRENSFFVESQRNTAKEILSVLLQMLVTGISH